MKSRIEQVAQLSMKLGARHLADYGSIKSRHDFTQRQLMSCLILKTYLKTTYRGVIDWLEGHSGLRRVLGLQHKLPHYTALQKFSARKDVQAVCETMIAHIGQAALKAAEKKSGAQQATELAVDSTGLEPHSASAHYVSRAGRQKSRYMKLSLMIVCGSLLPLGLVLDWGPNCDKCQARELLDKSFSLAADSGAQAPLKLFADAGYDGEWVHEHCREQWGVHSVIKPVIHRADGKAGGKYRSQMTKRRLKKQGYGRRWHIESFFSGMKRLCGAALSARREIYQRQQTALRVLAYALHR